MPWTLADIPSQSGRTAVVTGASGGLGLETAKALAGAGAHVILAARNRVKLVAARDSILVGHPAASLELVALDLASLAAVAEASAQILAAHDRVHILVNNAGVMAIPERRTADGFEMQLGVNHLAHWALTARLLPALLATPAARVVTVTSTAHHFGRPLDPADVNLERGYRPWRAYNRSKLANFHFGIGLQRAFERAGRRTASLVAHPGLSDTELQASSVEQSGGGSSQRLFHLLARRTGMSPEQGALSQLRAATDPRARGGELYGPLFVNNGPPVRKPVLRRLGLDQAIATLWAVSERATGVAMELDPAPRGRGR